MSGEVINDVRFHRDTQQGRAGKCPWDLVTRKLQIALKIEVMGHFDNCSNKLGSDFSSFNNLKKSWDSAQDFL